MGKPQAKVLFDYRRGMLPGVSGALVPEGAANTAKNVRFRGGIIERGEYSVYTTNLSLSSTDTPTAIFYHSDYKSDVHGILTTREKIFRKRMTPPGPKLVLGLLHFIMQIFLLLMESVLLMLMG